MRDSTHSTYNPWLHRLAVLTAIATFILILVGGLVTSTDSGLAVPDWPTTFGYNMFLYPLSKTVSGFLFSLDADLQSDLDNGKLSEALHEAIEKSDIPLSEDVTISTAQAGSRWKITDAHNQRTYTVIKAGDRLDIYVPGVLYEHSHRLIGSLVGLLTVALTVFIWMRDSRKWLKWLAVVALISVVAQGVMGGLRVVHINQTFAIIHACFAQAFFALIASFVLFTSREWSDGPQEMQRPASARMQRLSLLTTVAIYVQLIFGAILRHTGTRLDAHLLFAAVVTVHTFLLVRRTLRDDVDDRRLVRTAAILGGLLLFQLTLGIGAFLGSFTAFGAAISPTAQVAIATLHVSVGALMLIAALALTLRISRSTQTTGPISSQRLISEKVSV